MISVMLMASIAAMTSCTAEDPLEGFSSGNAWNNNGNMYGGNGSSATTGEIATFDIAIDLTTAEPTDAAEEYFPDDEDALENNDFTTEVVIDLSNPAGIMGQVLDSGKPRIK